MKKHLLQLLIFLVFKSAAWGQVKTLDMFLSEGLARSPLLKEIANQSISLKSDSALVRAVKKPQVEARSVLQYIPVYGSFGYDGVVTDQGNYQGMVGVSQDIFRKKEVGNKLESVGIQRRTLENSVKISTNELTKLITEQYLSSLSSYNDLIFNSSFLKLLEDEEVIVRQLASKGVYRQTDYLALLVESQTQRILVKQMRSEYSGSIRELNAICGISDTSTCDLTVPEIRVKSSPGVSGSPSYIQYTIDSLRISNESSSVDIRYRPKVSWFADAGFLSHDLMAFYSHFGYSAGVSISVPVYDGNQRKLEKQKLELEEKSRAGYRDNFNVRYNQETLRLLNMLKAQQSVVSDLEIQVKTSGSLLDTLKTELESGIIQMTEYIAAVKNFRVINKALIDSRIRVLQIVNELNYVTNQ